MPYERDPLTLLTVALMQLSAKESNSRENGNSCISQAQPKKQVKYCKGQLVVYGSWTSNLTINGSASDLFKHLLAVFAKKMSVKVHHQRTSS